MNYWCPGDLRLTTSKKFSWYTLNNDEPNGMMYCHWCYDNNCFDKSKVQKIEQDGRIKSNCCCVESHTKLHDVIKKIKKEIICPNCYFTLNNLKKNISKEDKKNKSRCFSCGGHVYNHNLKYCNICCFLNSICIICYKSIKTGDEYFNDFWSNFSPEYPNLHYDATTGLPLFILYRMKNKTQKQILKSIYSGKLYELPETCQEKQDKLARTIQKNWEYSKIKKEELEKESSKASDAIVKESDKAIGNGSGNGIGNEGVIGNKSKLNVWWNTSKFYFNKFIPFYKNKY